MTRRGWVFVILSACFAAVYEAAWMTFLPTPWRDIRPILQILVLLIVLNRPRGALVYAGIAGMLVDLFRVDAGAFSLGRFVVIAIILLALSETVLTNRSVYATTALMFAGRVIDAIWIWIVHAVGTRAFHLDIQMDSAVSLLLTLCWDIGLMSVAFMLIAVFTRRFLMTASRELNRYG